MKNRLFKVLFGSLAVCALALAGCSRLPDTKLQILVPEGAPTARIRVTDNNLDTVVAAVNGVVTFSVASNPLIQGNVSVGRKECAFIPDGTSLTIDLRPTPPVLTSDKSGSVNERMVANRAFEMTSVSDYSRKVQAYQADETLSDWTRDSLISASTKDFQNLVVNEYLRRAKEEKDNYIGVDAILKLAGRIPNERMDSLIRTMSPAVRENRSVALALESVEAQMGTEIGMPFKDAAATLDGTAVNLSDYIGKGKFVLLYFWSTWSGPSLTELSTIRTLYDRFEGDHFTVVTIGAWGDPDACNAVAKKQQFPWTSLVEGTDAARAYGIYKVPHAILFGPDGKILMRGETGEELIGTVSRRLQ